MHSSDVNHTNLVDPPKSQLYIGWEDDGEWTNYTVNVKRAGTYRVAAMHGNDANVLKFDIDGVPAGEFRLPVATSSMHKWSRAEIRQIRFATKGLQVLALHCNKGNQLAYFEFVPTSGSAGTR